MVVVKKKDERVRNWTFIVYPESAPENWVEILDELHVPWVESPLHDKDVDENGEISKAHWHIALFFNTKKSYEQILEIAQSVNVKIVKRIDNAKGMIRYFLHLDNPEKYQYPKAEMKAHGGADIEKYLTASGGDHLKILAEIQEWIDETGCVELVELARYAVRERMDDWYPVVATKSTIYLNAYLRSNRHSKKEANALLEPSTDQKILNEIEQEFLLVKSKEAPQKAKNLAYAGLKHRLEREYGSYVLKPRKEDLSRLEVILYKAIDNAIEND